MKIKIIIGILLWTRMLMSGDLLFEIEKSQDEPLLAKTKVNQALVNEKNKMNKKERERKKRDIEKIKAKKIIWYQKFLRKRKP